MGTHPLPKFFHVFWRFIPAGAGNSLSPSAVARARSVYPRWRGELPWHLANVINMYGLSPLARGTRQQTSYPNPPARFIPAGAGNSRNEALDCRNYAVYPRWRGELILFAAESLCRYGLSPLARGTHGVKRRVAIRRRFIPAGAGNSS
ncbi:Domain of uncharacterised function (DUF2825) [Escherichia coli]|nr:Domain of uncharacterised function (DUF2825) [Escherichia coli]